MTLDPDVELLLKEAARRTRLSFKEALNMAVREGLRIASPGVPPSPFLVKARSLQLRAGLDPAHIGKIGDDLELAAFLKTTKRLQELTP